MPDPTPPALPPPLDPARFIVVGVLKARRVREPERVAAEILAALKDAGVLKTDNENEAR